MTAMSDRLVLTVDCPACDEKSHRKGMAVIDTKPTIVGVRYECSNGHEISREVTHDDARDLIAEVERLRGENKTMRKYLKSRGKLQTAFRLFPPDPTTEGE